MTVLNVSGFQCSKRIDEGVLFVFGVRLVRQRLELTRLTSKKSIPPSPSSVNSARVAGGTAFAPAHSIFPEPQSPVTQLNFPFESSLQMVRPQNRPPQDDGASTALDSPSRRTKPVVDSGAIPALDKMPGQTVYSHLFTIVNVAEAITPGKIRKTEQ